MSSSIGMAIKSLRRRRLRTALTVSGIVVGVSLIFVLFALTNGETKSTSGFINTLSPSEITVVNDTGRTGAGGGQFFLGRATGAPPAGVSAGFFGGGGGGGGFAQFFSSGPTLNQSVVSTISGLSDVAVASPTYSTSGYVNASAVSITGIDPATYNDAAGAINLVNGTNLSNSTGADQIIVGQSLASSLNLAIGSEVTVGANSTGGSQFQVVGIYSTGNTFTERVAYVPLAAAQTIANKTGVVSEIYVKANSPGEVSTVESEIKSAVSGVSAVSPSTVTTAASSLAGTLTSFFTVIGLAALLAGGFGVINTMMMSISERTREIGALKAIGAKRSQIMKMFMSEAFLIGVIGGVVGVAIGLVVSLALPYLTGAATSSGFGSGGRFAGGFPGAGGRSALFGGALNPVVTPEIIVLSLGLGVVVGVVAGIYPAWRASKMNPVEALKHL